MIIINGHTATTPQEAIAGIAAMKNGFNFRRTLVTNDIVKSYTDQNCRRTILYTSIATSYFADLPTATGLLTISNVSSYFVETEPGIFKQSQLIQNTIFTQKLVGIIP